MNLKLAPYGTWDSPISAQSITEDATSLSDLLIDPVTSAVYHLEVRGSEGSRFVLVHTESKRDIVGPKWNMKTRVQEMGGAPVVVYDDTAYFSNFSDGRVYKVNVHGGEPEPITPEGKPYRFANFAVCPAQPHLIVSILEDHTKDEPSKVLNSLCVINASNRKLYPLAAGADFYACPTFAPDGLHLAWQHWSHPDMPWEGAQINIVTVSFPPDAQTVTLRDIKYVHGKHLTVSAAYPLWADADTLLFTSDESGYVNPWKYSVSKGQASPLMGVFPFDCARPAYFLGYAPMAVVDGTHVVVNAIKEGRDTHCLIPLDGSGKYSWIHSPYVVSEPIRTIGSCEYVFLGQKVDEGVTVVRCTLSSQEPRFSVVHSPQSVTKFPKSLISKPIPMTLQLSGAPVHVIYYPPHNPAYVGSSIEGEKPPCIVAVHGGPTALTYQGLDYDTQYWTSRGYAYLIVNYSGSAGYGRAYIERLLGQYGVLDLLDCVDAPRALAAAPHLLIDPKRTVIRGGSSGGYVVLNAISGGPTDTPGFPLTFKFAAATSIAGISDLVKLEVTHKFESNFMRKLLGGTSKEVPEVYHSRSPIHRADKITTPVLILQGEVDRVVPREQSLAIYENIRRRGGVVEYKEYKGEAHGGWRGDTSRDMLERELSFYEQALGIVPE